MKNSTPQARSRRTVIAIRSNGIGIIHSSAFTLIELLVVILIIVVLAGLLLTVLTSARRQAQGTTCLSSKKQMTIAWKMYVDDNAGIFPINAQEDRTQSATLDWVVGVESWNADNTDNTNCNNLADALLGFYMIRQIKCYKCPTDAWLCIESNTPTDRVRSVSMNCFIGTQLSGGTELDGVHWFGAEHDLVGFSPAELYLFADEHADTINDGFLLFNAYLTNFDDVPADYHNQCGLFSFTDGHAELHSWRQPQWWWPVEQGNTSPHPFEVASGPDAQWMARHATFITSP